MAKTILLIEDDIALRDIYQERFKAEGFMVQVATDGEEALNLAMKERPEIILLDIMLPKISGFDVLDILRNTPETKGIRIIVLSALSQSTDVKRGKFLGADLYLVKSQVTLSEVIEEVKKMLEAAPERTPEEKAPTAAERPAVVKKSDKKTKKK